MTNSSGPAERSASQRKLVAVVHADIVGYSRLIGLDDVGTLARVRNLRQELIDPAIAEHGGRIVNTAGDALLMVFDSVEGAVRCAVKMQQQAPTLEANQPPDRRICFRIGINVGDVIPDGTDLHGDVVNVAARLQAECSPGGICVSRGVREHVGGRLDLAFEALGPLNLKNIAQPVEAFIVRPDAAIAAKSVERTYGAGEALPLPDKPSIAVLAFTNMSGDPEQEHFSDGIADDIITELSRNHSLFVTARNSSFTYRSQSIGVKQTARELGVRYVLKGSVRRAVDRVRITAQLIDVETGTHVWAERYDRALQDIFAVQDEITAAVVTAIQPAVADAELRRILRRPPESLGAWEAYQRGLWHLGKTSLPELKQAQTFFQQALTIDAAFAPACAAMASSLVYEGAAYASRSLIDAGNAAMSWARRAVELDAGDPDAQVALAWTSGMAGHIDDALRRVLLALAISTNLAWGHCIKGIALILTDHISEGREALLTATRLSPNDPMASLVAHMTVVSYYFERDYETALEAARQTLLRYPDHPLTYRFLVATLGQLDRKEEAEETLRKALADGQSFEPYVRNRPPWYRPEVHEHILDGLRKAGWEG